MGIRELRKESEKWQTRLGLKEWDIRLVWGIASDQPDYWSGEIDHGVDANSWWQAEECRAIISIDKECADPLGTLVHELVHIRFEGHHAPDKRRYDPLYERAINATVAALLGY